MSHPTFLLPTITAAAPARPCFLLNSINLMDLVKRILRKVTPRARAKVPKRGGALSIPRPCPALLNDFPSVTQPRLGALPCVLGRSCIQPCDFLVWPWYLTLPHNGNWNLHRSPNPRQLLLCPLTDEVIVPVLRGPSPRGSVDNRFQSDLKPVSCWLTGKSLKKLTSLLLQDINRTRLHNYRGCTPFLGRSAEV